MEEIEIVEIEPKPRLDSKNRRDNINEKYVIGKFKTLAELNQRYFVLQQVLKSECFFNLLSVKTQSFVCSEEGLSPIFDCILEFEKVNGTRLFRGSKIKLWKKKLQHLFDTILPNLENSYDAVIIHCIVADFLNCILNQELRNELQNDLKIRLEKKPRKDDKISQDQRDAIYCVFGCLTNYKKNLLEEYDRFFPLPKNKEFFLSFQSGITAILDLISVGVPTREKSEELVLHSEIS